MNITTSDICHKLDTITDFNEFLFNDEIYYLLVELSLRCIHKLGTSLNKDEKRNVSCDVACNTILYLSRVYKTGFKVTNWLKFIYNKTLKTIMAQYDTMGNIRPEIIEIEDEVKQDEFINRMYFLPIQEINELNKVECLDALSNISKTLIWLIEQYIRYTKSYFNYNNIKYSVLLSIILNKCVYLYGLKRFEKIYVNNLKNIVKNRLISTIIEDIKYQDDEQINTYISYALMKEKYNA